MQQQVQMQPQIDKTEQRVCIKSYISALALFPNLASETKQHLLNILIYIILFWQARTRSILLQQLKELKSLEDAGILTTEQYKQQTQKVLDELTSI